MIYVSTQGKEVPTVNAYFNYDVITTQTMSAELKVPQVVIDKGDDAIKEYIICYKRSMTSIDSRSPKQSIPITNIQIT